MVRIFRRARPLLVFSAMAALTPSAPAAVHCPLAGQNEMLLVKLYLGEDIPGRGPLTDAEWRFFLAREVTPRFPEGFTVYQARGQWLNPKTRAIGAESTKVIEIAVRDTKAAHDRIGAVAGLYRRQFHQQSVGIVTAAGCGAF